MKNANEISALDWVAGGTYLTTTAGRIFYRSSGNGPVLVLLHGFPTWSYDWAQVATDLSSDHQVVTLDFPGYGFSDKRNGVDFSVGAAADAVEQLLSHLGIDRLSLVIHDFGAIVGQELLDRRSKGRLAFSVDAVHVLNNSIVYAAYRPTRAQKLLALPIIGELVARTLGKSKIHASLNAVRGENKLSNKEFNELWIGMSRDDGHKLAYKHIRYNAERVVHHERWEKALFGFDGRLQLIWGLADPVSGYHVLHAARPKLPSAQVVGLAGVGHFPPSEAPVSVAAAIRELDV